MGQYGIFDAFQAAAGATGTILDEFDKQNRLKAELEVQDAGGRTVQSVFNRFTVSK